MARGCTRPGARRRALGSVEAATPPGVSLDDRWYPLRDALNLPSPTRPGGPPIWLGGQRPRGLRMAAALADGWVLPSALERGVDEFSDRRGAILREMDALGRDASWFDFGGQLPAGETAAERALALDTARRFIAAGATHIILGMAAQLGPTGLAAVSARSPNPSVPSSADGRPRRSVPEPGIMTR